MDKDELIDLDDFRPKPTEPLPEHTIEEDTAFLEEQIAEADQHHNPCISDANLSVLLEMSYLCNWGGRGSTFTEARFKAARDAMTGVLKIGDFWFVAGSKSAAAARKSGPKYVELQKPRSRRRASLQKSRSGRRVISSGIPVPPKPKVAQKRSERFSFDSAGHLVINK